MNILIYTRFYPAPAELGLRSDTLLIHFFARELQRKGHAVQVVFLYPSLLHEIFHNRLRNVLPTETDYLYEGVPVHLIRYQSLTPHRYYPEDFQARIINGRLKDFKRSLGWKADKVFVHFPSEFVGLTEIFADGAPALGDFHNMDAAALDRPGHEKVAAFFARFDTWGFRNRRVRAALEKLGGRPLKPVYSGIDRSLLADDDFLRRKTERADDTMRILYAGQLIPLKHVDVLIRAVQVLPFPCALTIVGGGPERGRLEELSAGDPRIRFTGKLTREETIGRMRDADVFIMLSSPETYGLVYLEAMAQGCLTAASRGEGFDGLIVDGENGFLAEPGSVEAAVRVLERIHALSAEDRRAVLRKSAALARTMTEDQTAEGFLSANV